jgi:hypothetical protein
MPEMHIFSKFPAKSGAKVRGLIGAIRVQSTRKCLDEINRKKVMKSHVKTLIAIVIGSTLGTIAYAGPAGVYSNGGFASNTDLMAPQPAPATETIALYRADVTTGDRVAITTVDQSRLIPSGNPKSPGVMIEVAPGSILE